jgi:ribosome-binding protein aMBF1 (putative translation factor)
LQDIFALDVNFFCIHVSSMKKMANEMISDYLLNEERSASWLARKCGVSASTVTRWLSGDVKPTIEARRNLENVTGLPVSKEEAWTDNE